MGRKKQKLFLIVIGILAGLIVLPGCAVESACDVMTTPDQRSINLIFSFGDL